MIAIQQFDNSSPEEYLEAEKSSPIKHEYHDGELYAMAGASDEHVTIGMNIAFLLRQHLQGSGCRSYVFDMKVQIDAVNYFYYPDVMVSCDPRDQGFRFFKKYPVLILEVLSESTEATDRKYPVLILEVLSESTEATDRGKKFEHYRQLETLQEYGLVSQDRQRVEVFRKNGAGLWVLHPFGEGDQVELTSVGMGVGIAALYENVGSVF